MSQTFCRSVCNERKRKNLSFLPISSEYIVLINNKLGPTLQGGELGISADRDQQSTFLDFEFRKSLFCWVLVIAAVFLGVFNTNAVFLSV